MKAFALFVAALCFAPASHALKCAMPDPIRHAETLIENGIKFEIGYGHARTLEYQVDNPKAATINQGGTGRHQFSGVFITKDGLVPAEHFHITSHSSCLGEYCAGPPNFNPHKDGRPALVFIRHEAQEKDGVKTARNFIVQTPCARDIHTLNSTLDLSSLQHMLKTASSSIDEPGPINEIGLANLPGTTWAHKDWEPFYITFNTSGRMQGRAGCNQFNGRFKQGEHKLSLSVQNVTERNCTGAAKQFEEHILGAFKNTAYAYSDGGSDLRLVTSDKTPLMTLHNITPLKLWDLYETEWGSDLSKSLKVTFSKDGTVSGNSGCNMFKGSFKHKTSDPRQNDTFIIGDVMTTKRGCVVISGTVEKKLYRAFKDVRSLRKTAAGLDLIGANNAVLFRLYPNHN